MNGTDLSFVRERLKRCTPEEREALAKIAKVHPKTLRRIAERETSNPGAETVGRLAVHFRAIDERELA